MKITALLTTTTLIALWMHGAEAEELERRVEKLELLVELQSRQIRTHAQRVWVEGTVFLSHNHGHERLCRERHQKMEILAEIRRADARLAELFSTRADPLSTEKRMDAYAAIYRGLQASVGRQLSQDFLIG